MIAENGSATAGERRAMRAPRILFIGEAVSLAHVGRPAVLANLAKQAGYEVHFACGEAIASVARREGLDPIPLETIDPARFYGRLAKGKFFYTSDELEGYVRAEIALIDKIKPDLVVGDFRLTLDISTTVTGVPLVSLCNAHWLPTGQCQFNPPNTGLLGLLPKWLRNGLFSLVRPIAFRTFARQLDIVRRRYLLSPKRDFREHYTAGKYCGYLDIPELFPATRGANTVGSPNLPNGHFVLGPVAWSPHNPPPAEFARLGIDRPLAYVSLGSSGDTGVLPNVLRALIERGCDIALSGLKCEHYQQLCNQLPELTERCVSAPMFDPAAILKRASVTVCHGGSGTVYQSLAAGVPLLCLPANPDQQLVTASVRSNGAAIEIAPANATVANLSQALRPLLSGAIHQTFAKILADSVARCDAQHNWLRFLGRALPLEAGTAPVSPTSAQPSAHGGNPAIHRLPALRALTAQRNYSSVLVERLERFLDETSAKGAYRP
jgi:UDP:flavonoid glycosyltransferase YjiC (YdhE family)